MTYAELEKLPAEAYLNPDNFRTEWDKMHSPAREAERKQEGYDLGLSAEYVSISTRSVWGAKIDAATSVCSYEGIGYHAMTWAFLSGVLASKCPIHVHRYNAETKESTTTILNPR